MVSYVAENAKSGRSKCKKCKTFIKIEALRLGVMRQARTFDGQQKHCYHITCFFEKFKPKSIAKIKNFENLRIFDQDFIKKNINNNIKRRYSKKNKLDNDLDQRYKIQNLAIFKIRDTLKNNKYKWNDLKSFLLGNGQHRPRGVPAMLDMIAEILTCGALEKCKKCWFGRYYYDKNGYECQSYTQWSSCKNNERNPARKHWKIPENISKDFRDYLSSVTKRLEHRVFTETSVTKKDLNNKVKEKRADFIKEAKTLTMTLKSGSEVDPKSNLDKTTHIFEENGYIYNAALINSDIQNGKNSFYKIQLLENDEESNYWVFRSWGRIGTKIGSTKTDQFNSSSKAVMEFEKLFLKFTGNKWTDPDIYKMPRKYLPVEIDYGINEIVEKIIEPSQLEVPVQEFLGLITNIDLLKNILIELDIDIQKMPLGKITSNQLDLAASFLAAICNLISRGETDDREYIEASNQFYVAVPHNVGNTPLPVLKTKEQVLEKCHMLRELQDIKINYQIINFEQIDKRHPIDLFYENIKTEMKTISSDSKDFNFIKKYVENTHGSSHYVRLEIDKIFEINRDGEDQRYEPFKNFENKKLLWHGSRLTNFSGILKNGLKIAPPECYKISGDMFGKGVYFTDVVTKAARYCKAGSNGVGALLLCEVALGEFEEFDHSPHPSYITDLIQENKSCKGLGKLFPNPEESVFQDGVEIPLGKIQIDDNISGELTYNEYVVYNVDQIKCKYLVLLEFYNV